jgi:hypothetical protein
LGSAIDAFLNEEGIFHETQAQAVKEVVAWQLAEAMKKQKISKNKMTALLKTSRTQVIGCWIRKTTSRFRACRERRR